MVVDYSMTSESLIIHRDKQSSINIAKSHIQHSRTKHIDTMHLFIREFIEEKLIVVEHVSTDFQLAYIFTTPLDFNRFVNLRKVIGVCDL